jgi:2,4'-dihydroxyacetophenone dioxygenase
MDVDPRSLLKSLVPPAQRAAIHIGLDELPFVERGMSATQLLHVDLLQGLAVIRARFKPGFVQPTHYHAGMVFAVTEQGSWYYSEYPEAVNRPGSYLFEPAGSVHTLVVPPEQTEDTIAWYAVFGSTLDMDADGQVIGVTDCQTALANYRRLCAEQGLNCERLLVVGE